MTPWNVDTLSKEGFQKTVINKYDKKPESEMTDEELEEKHVSLCQHNFSSRNVNVLVVVKWYFWTGLVSDTSSDFQIAW